MEYISLSCIRYSRAWGSYQNFLYRGLLLTRKLLNKGFLLVKLKSSLRKFYGLCWPLWNIWFTNDHGYFALVANTSRPFPHAWLIIGFVTRLTLRVPLVEQELLTLPEHLSFSGVRVTRCLVVCVCFVELCLSFVLFFWPLCCLLFFDIRIIITPLLSSSSSLRLFQKHIVCNKFDICGFTTITGSRLLLLDY